MVVRARLAIAACLGIVGVTAAAPSSLVIESLTGAVTAKEIAAVKANLLATQPPVDGSGNVLVYGPSGKIIEACGSMYEVTHDHEILNRMILSCDAALYGRMDLLPVSQGGQRVAWTGKVEPVWPSQKDSGQPVGAAVEQGEVLGHLAYCIKLILQTQALQNQTVPDGDPHHYGRTYQQRALRYLKECDYVIDAWILPHFVDKSRGNHFYFPAGANEYKPNEPTPWNQLFMLTDGLIRLAECHALLNDDAKRTALYDGLVKANVSWFFESTAPQTTNAGTPGWLWAYSLSSPKNWEDTNHAAYDTKGLYLAYASGRYGITRDDLLPLANTYLDVVLATNTDGKFAGRVDGTTGTGHRGGDDYVRDEYLFVAEIRPESFEKMARIEIDSGKAKGSLPIVARLLWLKDRRFKAQ